MNPMSGTVTRQNTSSARDALIARIENERSVLALYLPAGTSLDQFVRLARDAVLAQPQLAECSSDSVLRALAKCAASGLPLDGAFSSLIVRKNKHGRPTATWSPSYRGLTALALASGFVRDVQAFIVRSEDRFHVEQGTSPRIEHVPSLLPNCGEVTAAYAWARLTTGGLVIEVMGRHDLQAVREKSPAGDSGPWGEWADEMSKAKVLRRLLKRLPAGTVNMPDGVTALQRERAEPATVERFDTTRGADPEHANALECSALERLHNAVSVPEIEAAWAQTQIEFGQARLALPLKVESAYHDHREALLQDAD